MALYKGSKKIAGLYKDTEIEMASEVHAGIIQIATQDETQQGVNDSKAVTPKKLKHLFDTNLDNYNLSKIDDYLYTIHYNASQLDYNYAIDYFENNYYNIPLGGCSALRKGNFFGRNYDWYYSNSVSFVVKKEANTERYASIGMAGGLSQLTKTVVESNVWNDMYKILPFFLLDGINEHGVTVSMNVVPVNQKGKTTGTHSELQGDLICTLMLPSYILDKFKTAREAVDWILNQGKIYAPYNENVQQEMHFLIADKEDTFVIEFVNDEAVLIEDKNYITNFYLHGVEFTQDGKIDYNTVTPYGQGLERYDIITEFYNTLNTQNDVLNFMRSLNYTNAYNTEDLQKWWKTEFVAPYAEQGEVLPNLTVTTPIETFESSGLIELIEQNFKTRTRSNQNTWQTVHTSVYDIDKKQFLLITQEQDIDKIKTFQLVPNVGDGKLIITQDGMQIGEYTANTHLDTILDIPKGAKYDNLTINTNANQELQNIAELTKDGTIKYDWIGTLEEYNIAVQDGIITDTTICYITDDEEPLIELASYSGATNATWGDIEGDIYEQLDLQEEFNAKADGLTYEDGLLYLTSKGEIISEGIEVSAGGGSGETVITLSNRLSTDEFYIANGDDLNLKFYYRNSKKNPATIQYIINNTTKYSERIISGTEHIFNIAQYLNNGYNYVQILATDVDGVSKSLFYTVNTVSLSISSTFDSSTVYTSPITFRYTPVGAIDKTIHFDIDGIETTEIISTSGRQQSKTIELTNGVHSLRVWATANLNGNTVSSNELIYEVLYSDGTTTLIATDFEEKEFMQGETINIPLIVYNPNALTTETKIYVNNNLVATLQADRNKFIWSTTLNTVGDNQIKIEADGSFRVFDIPVTESNIHIEPVNENLELFLSANGRNNNDTNKTIWSYGNTKCSLNNFNFVNNGWIDNALKISNGATVEIPIQIFKNDFRTNGKTIEIEFSTSNVLDFDSIVATCMSNNRGFEIKAQNAIFKSEQSEVKVRFKENERIRLGFVVENRSSNKLIYTYLNGIISGVTQYPDDDDFSQVAPVGITLGSDTCDIDLYTIRVYDTALTHYDMLNNYIADMSDLSKKIQLFNNNNIYDEYDNVVYNRILDQVPIMTITGELPPSKGDKKIVSVSYEDKSNPDNNFSMSGVTIDIQGTSSQYYPKKNYKISKMPQSYSLKEGMPAEKVFTLKADYMESSHAHNTGLAKFINNIYTTLTPPQKDNSNIRTTIYGFPIAVFYKENENSEASYFGIYNFNNDKESSNVFGFTEGCESWEFGNNTSDRCLLLSDDFSDSETVLKDFEARYPKDYTDFSNLQSLVEWIVACKNANDNGAKFKAECEEHFNLNFLLTYYVISEFFGMVDSRAKNMFLNLYTDGKWYPVFYDLDTAIGLNNEGVNDFGFDIEYHDTIGTENVFNGESSGLWNLVELCYSDKIEELYNTFRNNGSLTYENVMKCLLDEQIAKICEAQYNSDAMYKYISPLVEDNIATYLYTAQGSRLDHIKWWLYNRFNYMDSKYTASAYKSDYMTLRLYTPSTWKEVEPSATISVTPYADQYVKIKYGSYDVYERGKSGVVSEIIPPDITFNDTETILYGASQVTSVGDLSPLYAGTIDVSSATKLSELKIGHGGEYSNTNLKSLTLGNNTLLQKLDIRNCPNLSGALDISGCTNIKEIYATGTSLTSVKLASAGSLTDLILPETITNLTVKNQNNIENFVCGNNMTTLVIENSNLNSKNILESCDKLTKIRLIGIDWTLEDFMLLDRIYNMIGQDENGYNTQHGVIAGTIRMSSAKESVINEYKKKFIGLDFIVDNFENEDLLRTDFGEVITTNKGEALLLTFN